MKWKNLKGTGDNQASKPWLDIWKERTGYKGNPPCGRKGCNRDATLGAHVIKVDSDDRSWYLLPLCDSCNKLDDAFEKKADIPVAPAAK